ncbi:hypothetical protein [Phenylobacterium sp. J367]|uniref:hypothetical protein n=1 Tax=Phenylobacterium sp. J367 TaxID=2898435 RepID=UPI0021512D91|nr:hypothetical protein [Phenylobacterium sp. J367]MCR5881039.1 hypothetical protein [Phenylobacterium sp. J367]
MTTDYGLRGRRRIGAVAALGLGAVAVGVAAFAAWELRDFLERRAAAVATAGQWAVDGPPCPSLTPGKPGRGA